MVGKKEKGISFVFRGGGRFEMKPTKNSPLRQVSVDYQERESKQNKNRA